MKLKTGDKVMVISGDGAKQRTCVKCGGEL
jgi:3-dehydroquinate synthase class II